MSPIRTRASRGPRHCKKCPGNPLTKQCIHTKAGRKYLGSTSSNTTDCTEQDPSIRTVWQESHSSDGREYERMPDPSDVFEPTSLIEQQSMQSSSTRTTSTELTLPVVCIDPALVETPHHRTAPEAEGETPNSLATPQTSDVGSMDDMADTPTRKRKRARPTKNNPVFGTVEGAMRGGEQWTVARSKILRPLQTDSTKAAHRFGRVMEDIISRAERVALETNCWTFIAAQHPNATGQFIHYSSPRLRREAKSDMQDIVNRFHVMVNGLMTARRKDALELGKALAQAKRANEVAQQALETQRKEMAEKDVLIAQYKMRLGI